MTLNKHARQGDSLIPNTARPLSLRAFTEQALHTYFDRLNGHSTGDVYELVMREVEMAVFSAVMDHTNGNQSRAADILGINRGTLRRKLRSHGLSY